MKTINKIWIVSLVVLFILIAGFIIYNPKKNIVGEAAGLGVPTGFDNVNLTGALQVGVTQGNPNVMPTLGNGSISATGEITTTGTIYAPGGFSQGGVYSTTTPVTATSVTLSPAALAASVVLFNSGTTSAFTLTLPASSTLTSFIPNVGDTATVVFYNASTSMGTVNIIAGTGVNLQKSTSSAIMQAGGSEVIDFFHTASTSAIQAFLTANGI